MTRVFLAATLSGALIMSTAQAASISFFDDLSGSWSGSGKAYVTKFGEISAKCRVAISGSAAKLAMGGSSKILL